MNNTVALSSRLPGIALENVRVLLRADLNVPLNQDTILSDFRLQALRPTLDLLLAKRACILLVTHIGRPQEPDHRLSTKRLMPWFLDHNYPITYAQTIDQAAHLLVPARIVLLENIRFWPEEKTSGTTLAHKLHDITTFFVQDAFGALHRSDTTITVLPTLYTPEQRTIGLLVERELAALNRFLENKEKPALAIIGGAKLTTKLPLINRLLTTTDTIALLPPLSLAFAHARNMPTGSTLIDLNHREMVNAILTNAQKNHVPIVLPIDYVISSNGWPGPYSTVDAAQLKPDHMVITIGPRTQTIMQQYLSKSRTIIFNGHAGDMIYPQTCAPMNDIFKAMCNRNNAYTLVTGGDSVALLEHFKLIHCIKFCSTGGGASIAYLSGHSLVGLKPFC